MLTLVSAMTAVEEILLIPNAIPPHKAKSMLHDTMRMAMLNAVAREATRKLGTKTSVSDIELKRTGTSWTIDTINALAACNLQRPFYYILGSDSYFQFHTWRDYQAIARRCRIVVVSRTASDEKSAYLDYFNRHLSAIPYSQFIFLLNISVPVASADLRCSRVSNLDFKQYVPACVYRYILRHRLYGRAS